MNNYTNKVLTVIALCLVIQTVSKIALVEKAYASDVQKVVICSPSGHLCGDDWWQQVIINHRYQKSIPVRVRK